MLDGRNKRTNWVDVSTDEIWTFLGIVILMGIHRLPRVKNYWSTDSLLGGTCRTAVHDSEYVLGHMVHYSCGRNDVINARRACARGLR